MRATEFIKNLPNIDGKLFFIFGREEYLVRRCQNAILDRYLPSMRDLNLDKISENTSVEEFISKADQNPCFADARVLLAQDWNAVKSGDTKQLQKYLEQPNPNAVIVFVVLGKPDSRRSIVKFLNSNAVAVDADTPKPEELLKWVRHEANGRGVKLSEGGARLLCEISGQDMFTLLKELDKLKFLKRERISESDVLETASRTPEYNAFLLHDYMMRGNKKAAFELLGEIYAAEKTYIPLIKLIANKFRLLYCAKNHSTEPPAMAKNAVAAELKVHPYAAQIALKESARFSRSHLRNALKLIAEYDANIKTGGADIGLAAILSEIYLQK